MKGKEIPRTSSDEKERKLEEIRRKKMEDRAYRIQWLIIDLNNHINFLLAKRARRTRKKTPTDATIGKWMRWRWDWLCEYGACPDGHPLWPEDFGLV